MLSIENVMLIREIENEEMLMQLMNVIFPITSSAPQLLCKAFALPSLSFLKNVIFRLHDKILEMHNAPRFIHDFEFCVVPHFCQAQANAIIVNIEKRLAFQSESAIENIKSAALHDDSLFLLPSWKCHFDWKIIS